MRRATARLPWRCGVTDYEPGQKVVYRAPHVTPDLPGEEGVVTRDPGGNSVFVRYGNDTIAKSTPRELLEPIYRRS